MMDIWGEEGGAKFFISSGIFFLALDGCVWSLVLLPIHVTMEVGGLKKGQKWMIVQYCCLNPEKQMEETLQLLPFKYFKCLSLLAHLFACKQARIADCVAVCLWCVLMSCSLEG